MGKCILIGAGDLTMGELTVSEEDYVIAVDGGLSYCGILNVEPDLILGDFDSVSEQEKLAVEQLKQAVPEKICQLPVCKDDTDMLAAIKKGLGLGYTDFRIYAATGGRFDHTLANIQCLLYLKNHGAVGYLVDGTGMVLVLQQERCMRSFGFCGVPFQRYCPAVSLCRPQSAWAKVVFPASLCPPPAMTSPGAACKETFCKTGCF